MIGIMLEVLGDLEMIWFLFEVVYNYINGRGNSKNSYICRVYVWF